MKNISWMILAACCMTAMCGCHESDSKSGIGGSCHVAADCDQSKDRLICANEMCLVHCERTGCQTGFECADSGICEREDARECYAEKPCTEKGTVCSDEFVCVQGECSTLVPCSGGKHCSSGHVCVDCLTSYQCEGDFVCSSEGTCVECVSNVNCAARGLVCDKETNRCVSDTVARCSAGSCPTGQACGLDGVCFDAECSPFDPCPDGKFCQNKACVDREHLICYADADCGEGYGCDAQHCVAADACSLTRKCPEGMACHEGKCITRAASACDRNHACDGGLTCVAGVCVDCHCEGNQVCTVSGACVDADYSEKKSMRVGDECVWTADFAFCDENRVFTCSSESGSDVAHVGVQNCGARTCATAPEDGIGCYDACNPAQNEDFYGVCIEPWGDQIAFTWQCDMTPEGAYVWSLRHGYQECLVGCENGRCGFEPPEFKENCTTASYPDACQGNWLTYCYSTSSSAAYGGIKTGTYCSGTQFCALPSARTLEKDATIIGNCVDACEEADKTKHVCMRDEDGNAYSYLFLCASTDDGRLGLFPLDHDYRVCQKGCDETTGECVE